MAVFELDFPSDGATSSYRQIVTLSDNPYKLYAKYNTRTEAWYISLYTLEDEAIIKGRLLCFGVDLLERSDSPNRPPGTLFCLTKNRDFNTPGLTDIGIGARCGLYYNDREDT